MTTLASSDRRACAATGTCEDAEKVTVTGTRRKKGGVPWVGVQFVAGLLQMPEFGSAMWDLAKRAATDPEKAYQW